MLELKLPRLAFAVVELRPLLVTLVVPVVGVLEIRYRPKAIVLFVTLKTR